MGEYKRLTTDEPCGLYRHLHNMTKIKNREVYLQFLNGEISLVDYSKKQCKNKCDIDINIDIIEFGESIMDCDCVVSYFYALAIGHAELRSRLKKYEDSGLSPEELKS